MKVGPGCFGGFCKPIGVFQGISGVFREISVGFGGFRWYQLVSGAFQVASGGLSGSQARFKVTVK